MARGISEFKSKLTQGGARPNLFMVRLNFPNELSSVIDFGTIDANSATEKAQFLVKTAQIPASTIGSIDVPFRGRMLKVCLLYTSPSPRDGLLSRMPSSA